MKIAIVGAADSDYGSLPDRSELQLVAQASRRALDDAGFDASEVDGLFVVTQQFMRSPSQTVAEYLGLRPRYEDSTAVGGSSFEVMVEHALAALQAKRIEVALIAYGSTMRSSLRSASGPLAPALSPIAQMYETPFGMTLPAAYALAAQRHMHAYGTSGEQLARIAVAARAHATKNPLAMYRDPLTVEEVLASPLVASPLHKLDCCVVSDGGGAIVLTNETRASSAAKRPVWVLGAAQGTTHHMISQMPDLTTSAAAETGRRAMSEAGVTPDDVDLLMMYDSFTITALIGLEDLGFCAKGDGGAFVEEGNIDPGGRLPMNVDGGGLSANHPGMRGIFLLTECVRQLRDESGDRQVDGAEVAVAHGVGGWLSSHATVVLGRG